jgi:hypothetical protein
MRHWLIGAAIFAVGISATQAADDWRISTLGYGPARLGMTLDEASAALGVALRVEGEIDEPLCYYAKPIPEIPGLSAMVSQGRIVRFDVREPGLKTRSGLGIGDSEARVIEVLGAGAVEVTPHKYLAPAGNYLTVWSNDRQAAVRFETLNGQVTAFYAGRAPEVLHVEGCS